MSETSYAYVARARCGCVTGLAVDDPKHAKEVAKDVASWMRQGDTVDRVTVAEARTSEPFYSKQNHPRKGVCLLASPDDEPALPLGVQ